MNSNYIKIDDTLNSNICLSFYKPDLNDFKLETEFNLKRQQEKCNILKEILSSEKKYLSDIREIVEGYYEEFRRACPNDFPYHIFSNIKDIFEFTKQFYSLLEVSTNDEAGIANCFIKKHKTFLKLYSTYCQNYKLAYNTTEKLEKEHQCSKIIQKVRLKYGHCLKLATYLQLPVLRITKYHLLLQRYLKLLDKDTPGYNLVLEALNLMKQVNDQINNEMPKDESSVCYERITSTANIQNLIRLFGSILKQGNLVLNDTKKVHYVIIFQTMLVIRKSDSPYKVLHSISNEYLALLPKTSWASSAKTKYFTIIDYSQAKDDEMWQFTFKAKSYEDKQTWQSSILSCMLNGYGKKLSENVRTKVMKMDSFNESTNLHRKSSNDIFRQQINNIKRLTDFKGSVKNDPYDHKLDSNTYEIENDAKRRFSTPQSRFSKILDRTFENGTLSLRRLITKQNNQKEEHMIDNIFPKLRKEKSLDKTDTSIISNKENLPEHSILNPKITYREPIEKPKRIISSDASEDLDSSFEEISNSTDENEIFKKIIENNFLPQSENFNPDTLSKSSMNSEEGYYSSNHDTSLSTLVVDQVNLTDDSMCTLRNFPRTVSTPEIAKQLQYSLSCEDESPSENYKIQIEPNLMSVSLHEPIKSCIKFKSFTEPAKNENKKPTKITKCLNLNEKLDKLSENKITPDLMSMSMTTFSRIKDLRNIFEDQSLCEFKSNSVCSKSKSINSLQSPIYAHKSPVHKKPITSKIIDIHNQITNSKISSQGNFSKQITDTEDDGLVRLNVKELINKFENNSNISNKSNF